MPESKIIVRVDVNKNDPGLGELLKESLPLVVKFTAMRCAPCKALHPLLEQVAQEYEGRVRVIEIDVERSPECAEHLQVQGLPSLLFFSNGKLVKRCVGALPLQQLKTEFESLLWYIDATGEAQSIYHEAVRVAKEKLDARMEAAFQRMYALADQLPEAKGYRDIQNAAQQPVFAAINEEMKEQKAQVEAGTLENHVYQARCHELFERLKTDPRFKEALDKAEQATARFQEAAAAAGITQANQAEVEAATAEHNAAIEAAQKQLVGANPSS